MVRKRAAGDRPRQRQLLIVDDHPMMRERLREVIEQETDLVVCGEAEDRDGALRELTRQRPDLVVVDLSLKNSSGLELIKDIRARYPSLRVLVLSMHDEAIYAERSLRAGARGYITKQEATRKIVQAIRTVLNGEMYLPPDVAKHVAVRSFGELKEEPRWGMDKLSDRELEVFRGLAKGWTTRQIADSLGLDVKTIETYRARLKEKLGFADATELLQAAIRWGYTQKSL